MRMQGCLILLAVLLVPIVNAQPDLPSPKTYGPYVARVVRIIDGDSIKLNVAIWLDQVVTINFRLSGVDTPEMRGAPACEKALGQKAKDFTEGFLAGAGDVWISYVRGDKFAGRALGKLEVPGKGDLNQALIDAGLARPYQGKKRQHWCKDQP